MMSRAVMAALAVYAATAQLTPPSPSTPWAMRRRPFDIISVTPSPVLSGRSGAHSFHAVQDEAGRFRAENLTVHDLARFAFQLDDARIIAESEWINSSRFDIVANVDSELPADLFPSMIRAVLMERFKFISHLETRQFPAYALVRAHADAIGPGLLPSHVNCAHPQRGRSPDTPLCGIVPDRWGHLSARGVTLKEIAANMRHWSPRVDRAIVDRTGIAGRFDFDLSFFPIEILQLDTPSFVAWFDRFGFRSVFTAVEQQLGLALVDAETPGDILVIDHAELPSSN